MKIFELFIVFFKIGLLTFGGGYAMIPMIEAEALSRGWITEEMLYNFLAISESTPGSFAVNISTFVGNNVGGILGSIVATLGVILPSFIIILIIFQFYKKFITNKYVKYVLFGLRAVVVGLILGVAINLVSTQFINNVNDTLSFNYVNFIIFGILFLSQVLYKFIFKRKMNPIILILLSAIIGLVTFGFIVR